MADALSSLPFPKPTLAFADMSAVTMTACQSANVNFQLSKEIASMYAVNLRVIAAKDQSIPTTSQAGPSTSATQTTPALTTFNAATTPALRPSSSTTPTSGTARPTSSGTSPKPSTSPAATSPSKAVLGVLPVASSPSRKLPPFDSLEERSVLEERTILPINQTINSSPHPANASFPWTIVNVPAGRYYLTGDVNDFAHTVANSSVFTVVEGSDTSCLGYAAALSLQMGQGASTSTINTNTASQTNGATHAGTQGSTRARNGLSGGAIAGIVIGVLAGVGLLGLLAFCLFRRRKRSATRSNSVEPGMVQTKRPIIGPYGGIISPEPDMDSHAYAIGLPTPHVGDYRNIAPAGTVGYMHSDGPFVEARRGEIGDMSGSSEGHVNGASGANPFATAPPSPSPEDHASPSSPWGHATLAAIGGGAAAAAAAAGTGGSGSVDSHGERRTPLPFRVSSAESSPISPTSPHSLHSPVESAESGVTPRSGASTPPSESSDPTRPAGLETRRGSKRRKPVPVLGPELAQEMRADNDRRSSGGRPAPALGMGIMGLGGNGSDSSARPHQLEVAPPLPQHDH